MWVRQGFRLDFAVLDRRFLQGLSLQLVWFEIVGVRRICVSVVVLFCEGEMCDFPVVG